MKINSITEPVAIRKLKYSVGNNEKEVTVTIGKPVPFDDKQDFYCPYCIQYEEEKKFGYVGGVDAIQALELSFRKIGSELFILKSKKSIEMTWLGGEKGDAGFGEP